MDEEKKECSGFGPVTIKPTDYFKKSKQSADPAIVSMPPTCGVAFPYTETAFPSCLVVRIAAEKLSVGLIVTVRRRAKKLEEEYDTMDIEWCNGKNRTLYFPGTFCMGNTTASGHILSAQGI